MSDKRKPERDPDGLSIDPDFLDEINQTILIYVAMDFDSESGELKFFPAVDWSFASGGMAPDGDVIAKIKELGGMPLGDVKTAYDIDLRDLAADGKVAKKVELIYHLAYPNWTFGDDIISMKKEFPQSNEGGTFRGLHTRALGSFERDRTAYLYNRNHEKDSQDSPVSTLYQLDLHINIKQKLGNQWCKATGDDDCMRMTPVIIDPGVGNDGSGGDP